MLASSPTTLPILPLRFIPVVGHMYRTEGYWRVFPEDEIDYASPHSGKTLVTHDIFMLVSIHEDKDGVHLKILAERTVGWIIIHHNFRNFLQDFMTEVTEEHNGFDDTK